MAEYNISTFIPIVQSGLIENNKKETAARLLLESIEMPEYIDFSAAMITRLLNREREIQDTIKKASAAPDVIANTIHYFEDVIVPDLNPHSKEDTCSKLIKLLTKDASVPHQKQDELTALYHAGHTGEFLAKSFLYALNRPNKRLENDAVADDLPLLFEVNNKCPLCHKPLIKTVNKRSVRKYKITQIYDAKPRNTNKLKAYDNRIALCVSCSLEHQTLDVEFANELFDIKTQYAKKDRLKKDLDGMNLEDGIKDVIDALGGIQQVSELEEMNLNALKISEKILPENAILLYDLTTCVLKYYRFIEDAFTKISNFESIALSIRQAFIKTRTLFQTQDEVVDELTKWLLQHTNLPHKHLRACGIIVAFFVQNCEVFDEITQ